MLEDEKNRQNTHTPEFLLYTHFEEAYNNLKIFLFSTLPYFRFSFLILYV
jgi:hypothetical protein